MQQNHLKRLRTIIGDELIGVLTNEFPNGSIPLQQLANYTKREKFHELRQSRTFDDVVRELNIPRSTAYYWLHTSTRRTSTTE